MYLVLVLHPGVDEITQQIIPVDCFLLLRVTCIDRLEVLAHSAARLAGRLTHAMIPADPRVLFCPSTSNERRSAILHTAIWQLCTPMAREKKAKMNQPCQCITLGARV